MRTDCTVAALSLLLLLSACGPQQEPATALPDDLAKDLAAASAPGLATAPQSFNRMRFVSDIEQSRATERAMKSRAAHQHHSAPSAAPVPDAASDVSMEAVVTLASAAPAPVLTAESTAEAPSVVVAARPAPEPQHTRGGPSAEGDVLDHAGSGGGVGSILGGIVGTVVIRGGRAGMGKCDPRTDARNRPSGRPDFSMPSPVGRPIFGNAGRR